MSEAMAGARRAALLNALAWQLECGVEDALSESPIDWRGLDDAAASARSPGPETRGPETPGPETLNPRTPGPRTSGPPAPNGATEPGGEPARTERYKEILRRAKATPPPKAAPAAVTLDPDAVETEAKRAAAGAETLEALKAALEGFEGSSLKAVAKRCVFADGAPGAPLMLIGEAPGKEEDAKGLPFVGRSGQLLDRMLAAIGRDRRSEDPERAVYITNVVPYRPLENRTPADQEVRILMPFLMRHIALSRPRVVACLGGVPAKHLMDAAAGITRFRGTWTDLRVEDRAIPTLATFHPAYLLRSPDQKRHAWRDLLALEARLRAEA